MSDYFSIKLYSWTVKFKFLFGVVKYKFLIFFTCHIIYYSLNFPQNLKMWNAFSAHRPYQNRWQDGFGWSADPCCYLKDYEIIESQSKGWRASYLMLSFFNYIQRWSLKLAKNPSGLKKLYVLSESLHWSAGSGWPEYCVGKEHQVQFGPHGRKIVYRLIDVFCLECCSGITVRGYLMDVNSLICALLKEGEEEVRRSKRQQDCMNDSLRMRENKWVNNWNVAGFSDWSPFHSKSIFLLCEKLLRNILFV